MKAREPIDAVQTGDVIWWNGRLRKVRRVSFYPDGRVRTVTFAILRRSWTTRPYTVYTRIDARYAFGGVLASGVSLCTTREECLTQREVEQPSDHDRLIDAAGMVGRVY